MTETDPIHPNVRKFARETGAKKVRPMVAPGSGRIEYGEDGPVEILHIGVFSEIPDGYQANLTTTPTITIDLFPVEA